MTVIGWIVVGVSGWLVAAVVLGLLLGRILRNRDEEKRRGDQ